MSGTIIIIIIAFVLGSVAYWFGLRPEKQPAINQRWLVLFMGLMALFLFFNAFLAFIGRRSLGTLIDTPAITSAADWQSTASNESIILIGSVSDENAVQKGENVVAYFECDNNCYLMITPPLQIDLNGITVSIENRDFQERRWVYERGLNYSYYTLAQLDPVVVIGTRSDDRIHAEFVFRGRYQDFINYTENQINKPTAIMALSVILAVAFLAIGYAYWDRSIRE